MTIYSLDGLLSQFGTSHCSMSSSNCCFLTCTQISIKFCEKWKWKSLSHDSLLPHRLYSPWNSLGQNTGVGSLSLLQGNFPIQGSNSGLPHCRRILVNHKGSPRILEWVACSFSSKSSWPRNWTGVSFIAGSFFNWAIREAQLNQRKLLILKLSLTNMVVSYGSI